MSHIYFLKRLVAVHTFHWYDKLLDGNSTVHQKFTFAVMKTRAECGNDIISFYSGLLFGIDLPLAVFYISPEQLQADYLVIFQVDFTRGKEWEKLTLFVMT